MATNTTRCNIALRGELEDTTSRCIEKTAGGKKVSRCPYSDCIQETERIYLSIMVSKIADTPLRTPPNWSFQELVSRVSSERGSSDLKMFYTYLELGNLNCAI